MALPSGLRRAWQRSLLFLQASPLRYSDNHNFHCDCYCSRPSCGSNTLPRIQLLDAPNHRLDRLPTSLASSLHRSMIEGSFPFGFLAARNRLAAFVKAVTPAPPSIGFGLYLLVLRRLFLVTPRAESLQVALSILAAIDDGNSVVGLVWLRHKTAPTYDARALVTLPNSISNSCRYG